MSKSLYICYFGVREPLVQTQVIPYLREIIKGGTDVHLLTFEPTELDADVVEAETRELAAAGITWHRRRYHKWPSVPATSYDIVMGALAVRALTAKYKYDVLHCRIHVPMLMAAIARKLMRHKPKLLFDIRGFFPEEYTDAGVWPEGGWLYRGAKSVERWLMRESDGFVVLTKKAREILFPEIEAAFDEGGIDKFSRPVEVVPCCIDLERFSGRDTLEKDELKAELGLNGRLVITYVGSFGGWYLSDEMFEFFRKARTLESNTFVLVLTQRDVEKVKLRLKDIGFGENDFIVKKVAPSDVPKYISAADFAVSFILKCYSKMAASPTKIAEYLACGLPIIANRGVGDLDEMIESDGVGVLLADLEDAGFENALLTMKKLYRDEDIRHRCIKSASLRFDIRSVGGPRYRRLYSKLLKPYEKDRSSSS